MRDPTSEIAAIMRRHEAARTENYDAIRHWERKIELAMTEAEAREVKETSGADGDADGGTAVPAGAPPEYKRVKDLVQRGELDWADVLTGNSDDRDVYAVHRWLSAQLEQAKQLMEAGGLPDVETGAAPVGHGWYR